MEEGSGEGGAEEHEHENGAFVPCVCVCVCVCVRVCVVRATTNSRSVLQRLDHGEVRVGEVGVLPNESDAHAAARGEGVNPPCHALPLRDGGHRVRRDDVKALEHSKRGVLLAQHERDVVNILDVVDRDDGGGLDVAVKRDLRLRLCRQRVRGAADHEVRVEAEAAQRLDGVLRRLRLLLADGADDGDERDVAEAEVLATDAELKLPQRLAEHHRLDVAHRAAKLDEAHVWDPVCAVDRDRRDALNVLLNHVGAVRNHLDRLAEVVTLALLRNHLRVHLPRRDVVIARQLDAQEALVVAEVEVALAAVLEHKHFAVLERRHRSRVRVL